MVFDKERKIYICDICQEEFSSFWRVQWHYFMHGLRKDELPNG